MFVFTCAYTDRPEHGTRKTTPLESYGTRGKLSKWQNYYEVLTLETVASAIPLDSVFSEYRCYYSSKYKDIFFWGIKKGTTFNFPIPEFDEPTCTRVMLGTPTVPFVPSTVAVVPSPTVVPTPTVAPSPTVVPTPVEAPEQKKKVIEILIGPKKVVPASEVPEKRVLDFQVRKPEQMQSYGIPKRDSFLPPTISATVTTLTTPVPRFAEPTSVLPPIQTSNRQIEQENQTESEGWKVQQTKSQKKKQKQKEKKAEQNRITMVNA
jgi:hypothetical protein